MISEPRTAVYRGSPHDGTVVTLHLSVRAGGMSVNYLLLSPLARGLFARAISESGTSLTMGDLQTPQQAALALKPFYKHIGGYPRYYNFYSKYAFK